MENTLPILVVTALALVLIGNLVQAHAVLHHLKEPRPSMWTTWGLYWKTEYYTPRGRHLTLLANCVLYPLALILLVVGLAFG
jgi:hypothetical protein